MAQLFKKPLHLAGLSTATVLMFLWPAQLNVHRIIMFSTWCSSILNEDFNEFHLLLHTVLSVWYMRWWTDETFFFDVPISLFLPSSSSFFADITSEGKRVRQLPDNTLLIENAQREDAGTYVCQAQIRGRPIYQQLSVSVVINGQYLPFVMFEISILLLLRLENIYRDPPFCLYSLSSLSERNGQKEHVQCLTEYYHYPNLCTESRVIVLWPDYIFWPV